MLDFPFAPSRRRERAAGPKVTLDPRGKEKARGQATADGPPRGPRQRDAGIVTETLIWWTRGIRFLR